MNCMSYKPCEPVQYDVASETMLRDVETGKVGYWVSLEYVMCLFHCISKAQGLEGASVLVEMTLMFFFKLSLLTRKDWKNCNDWC